MADLDQERENKGDLEFTYQQRMEDMQQMIKVVVVSLVMDMHPRTHFHHTKSLLTVKHVIKRG